MTAENKQWLQNNMGMTETNFTQFVDDVCLKQIDPSSPVHKMSSEEQKEYLKPRESSGEYDSFLECMKRGRNIMNKHHEETQIKLAASLPDEVF